MAHKQLLGVYQWWAGTDEERMTVGPELSREDIIAAGKAEFDDEPFVIMEAMHSVPSVPDGDRFIEMFVDKNEDLAGEDATFGDDMNPPAGARAELTAILHATFTAWLDKHDAWPTVWMFSSTRNQETINPEPIEDDGDTTNGD